MFSCISRTLNTHNGFSLPKLQKLCNDAYKTRSIVEHIVMENNCDWYEYVKDFVYSKDMFVAGIKKVCYGIFVCCASFDTEAENVIFRLFADVLLSD